MFAAFSAGDREKFRAVTASDFYAFDVGVRFTADALLDLIDKAKSSGTAYVWTVNEPEVRVVGDVAWITYVNRGSITDDSGKKDITWLE